MEIIHKSVLLVEVIEQLAIAKGEIVYDATVGEGGHSEEILKRIGPEGFLFGTDLDSEALSKAYERLRKIGVNFTLFHGNFKDIDSFINGKKLNKILLDLGVSSFELEMSYKGFSFMAEGPLDMRMNKSMRITASQVLNSFTESEIADILFYYGEERLSRKIARIIAEERKKKRIESTLQLAEICAKAYPKHYNKIHPATRTFQALRIYVNDELNNLKIILEKAPGLLSEHGRIAVISYHSLEDRIVKNAFKNDNRLQPITKKPIVPSREEVRNNRRARSAKMRVAEKI